MEYRTLGRTGLNVSVMGIGGGGPSRLGKRDDINTEADSIAIVLQGLDAGINFIDTAEVYGTEEIVGKAVAQRSRDSVVISTKKSTWGERPTPENLVTSLEASLRRLQTDYVDIYHLHGLHIDQYDYALHDIMPALQRLQGQGKIRFIGVTEAWNHDVSHDMLQRAVRDEVWDVMMVGFNLLNQTARESVFAHTIEKNIGVLIMFAVRRVLSQPEKLRETIQTLIADGQLDPADIDMENPLAFLIDEAAGVSMSDAAYRFCRDEPGTHVILSGTSNPDHLRANIAAFNRPPLPPESVQRLKTIFRNVKSITGE